MQNARSRNPTYLRTSIELSIQTYSKWNGKIEHTTDGDSKIIVFIIIYYVYAILLLFNICAFHLLLSVFGNLFEYFFLL